MKKNLALLALFLTFLPGALVAQATKPAPAKAYASLEYSDDETQLIITDPSGNSLVPADGLVLPVGSVIRTLKTTAELRLNPNGTIVKLSASTTFKIENLRGEDGTGSNDFALAAGKIRAVAAKLTGSSQGPGYTVRTATANCGVRGTDFAMGYDPDNRNDWVCVQDGQVDFTNITTGATVPVAASQFANTFAPVFQATVVDASRLAELFSDLSFVKLNPLDVPTKAVEPVVQPQTPAPAPAPAPAPNPAPEKRAKPAANDALIEFLRKYFGLEIGSVTIDGTTYSKAILSPIISADNFRLGLYLPVIYTSDLFNTGNWYKPAGNNEWSFGSDKSGLANQASDIAADLILKIRFLEWGTQGVDPFYLKVGNLETMTLGHGSVVRDFANDQDFPAVREVGLNAGGQFGAFSFEALADNLAYPSVVGGRVAVDLIGDQVSVGLQTTADLHLANDRDLQNAPGGHDAAYYGDPVLLVGGVDAQLFKLDQGSEFRTKAFADVNTLVPYFRADSAPMNAVQGFDLKTFWHDGGLGSVGGEAGFLGNISIVDYRLSFQAGRGLYSSALFQGDYYRTRHALLQSLQAYLRSPSDSNLNLGIFGSAAFNLFGFLTMDAAYRYPLIFAPDGTVTYDQTGDFFKLGLHVSKDKLPLVNLSGGVSYERTGVVATLLHGGNWFDANTILQAEVVYGLAQGVDLALGIGTAAVVDGSGNTVYENGIPKVAATISLDTRISF